MTHWTWWIIKSSIKVYLKLEPETTQMRMLITYNTESWLLWCCFYLIGATEERLSCVHLHQDAPQRPHVDGQVVRHPQQNLRRAVEPALDVLIDLRENQREFRDSTLITREEDFSYFSLDLLMSNNSEAHLKSNDSVSVCCLLFQQPSTVWSHRAARVTHSLLLPFRKLTLHTKAYQTDFHWLFPDTWNNNKVRLTKLM